MVKVLNLDGFRGLLAVIVYIYHCAFIESDLFYFTRNLFPNMNIWGFWVSPIADTFFCMGGFVLTHVYHKSFAETSRPMYHHLKFLFFRFARLWPLHFLTTSLVYYFYSHFFTFRSYILEISFLIIFDRKFLNSPCWSICTEFTCYLVFPLYLFILRKLIGNTKKLKKLQRLISFNIFIVGCHISYFDNPFTLEMAASMLYRTHYSFLFGMTLYFIFEEYPETSNLYDILFILLNLFWYFWVIYLLDDYPHFYIFAPIFLPFCVVKSKSLLKWIFNTKLMMYLGEVSFSIYIMHTPYVHFFNHLMVNNYQYFIFLSILVIFLVFCYVTFVCVECFFRDRLRQLWFLYFEDKKTIKRV